MERLKKWMTLAALPGWGAIRVKKMVASLGSLDLAWERVARTTAGFDQAIRHVEEILACADERGDWSMSWEDPRYPSTWRSIADAPVVLHGRGRKDVGQLGPFAAVVGTRKCCEEAANVAFRISRMLTNRGWAIASGLARGVDAAAHRGALYENGTTVACLGHGLDRIYPIAHEKLAHSMIQGGGALLSEYLPGSLSAPWQFASRNRLVVGLSEALVLIQSPRKGGAMVSASCAIDSGRDMWVYRPKTWGRRWEGNQNLIEAFPDTAWSDPEELMERMGLALSMRSRSTQEEMQVAPTLKPLWLSLVGTSGKLLDQLVLEHNLTREQTRKRLFLLELSGKVQRLPGGWYVPLVSTWGDVC